MTSAGRVAYGPVTAEAVPGVIDALSVAGDHALCLGPTEDIPYLKNQERLTFARIGVTDPLDLADYEAHGGLGRSAPGAGHGAGGGLRGGH